MTWKNKYGEKHKHWIRVYIILAFGGVHSSQILLHVRISIDICVLLTNTCTYLKFANPISALVCLPVKEYVARTHQNFKNILDASNMKV